MVFRANFFPKLREMLIGRYGNPTAEKVEQVQNRMGATFDNPVSEWQFREGTLLLERRYTDVNTGVLRFINPVVQSETQIRDQQKARMQGKRAF
jgi:hypothetical protein